MKILLDASREGKKYWGAGMTRYERYLAPPAFTMPKLMSGNPYLTWASAPRGGYQSPENPSNLTIIKNPGLHLS